MYFLIILCILYLIYCISFIGTLCYTIYKEHNIKKRKPKITNNFYSNIQDRFPTIIEIDEFIDSDDEN
jgi:hypothetical protein